MKHTTKKKKRDLWKECLREIEIQMNVCRRMSGCQDLGLSERMDAEGKYYGIVDVQTIVQRYAKEAKRK